MGPNSTSTSFLSGIADRHILSSPLDIEDIKAKGGRYEVKQKKKDEVETVCEGKGSSSVWIWRPDDLRLQSRLALTVVSGERGTNLKMSGDPQSCNIKARAGTLCGKPTEQFIWPYLHDSGVKIRGD
ncbi:hypothetical protein PAMA_002683 [Pampus argenteus]